MIRNHHARTSVLPLLMAGLGFAACSGSPKAPRVEGDLPGDCGDQRDNDGDGFLDCEDAGCAEAEECTREADDESPHGDPETDPDSDSDGPHYWEDEGGVDGGDDGPGEPWVELLGTEVLTVGDSTELGSYDCALIFEMAGYGVESHTCAQCDYVFDVHYQFDGYKAWAEGPCPDLEVDRHELIGFSNRFELRLAYDGEWVEYPIAGRTYYPAERYLFARAEWSTGYWDVVPAGESEPRYLTHYRATSVSLFHWP